VQGSEFYERVKVAEGCEKGFVHILDSKEAVEHICGRQADYLRVRAPHLVLFNTWFAEEGFRRRKTRRGPFCRQ
jgi:hypothetical protein